MLFSKPKIPAFMGTAIEYYDIALYTYMAPVLVEVFFYNLDKITAYFYFFLFELFSGFSQLLGAHFFGKMGDKTGRKKPMYYSMLGISIVTFIICLLPTYKQIGGLATILFLSCRAMQSFFLGGEYNGGAIYCLEHESDQNKHGMISGLYCAFTVVGIIIASFIASVVNYFGSEYFRIAYAFSFILAFITFKIRKDMVETPEYLSQLKKPKITQNNFNYALIAMTITSLYFGLIYGVPTRLFNVLLPIAIGINSSKLMFINTIFLVLYMLLLVVFGWVSDKITAQKLMTLSVVFSIILVYPLMLLIETRNLTNIILAKAVFAGLAASFIAPIHSFSYKLFNARYRYSKISICYALGKCGNVVLLAWSLKIYEKYHNITTIGMLLVLMAIITLGVLLYGRKAQSNNKSMKLNLHMRNNELSL